LARSFDTLASQVREAIARNIARTVAQAVAEAVQAALPDSPAGAGLPAPSSSVAVPASVGRGGHQTHPGNEGAVAPCDQIDLRRKRTDTRAHGCWLFSFFPPAHPFLEGPYTFPWYGRSVGGWLAVSAGLLAMGGLLQVPLFHSRQLP
jgi:hypothetical protein